MTPDVARWNAAARFHAVAGPGQYPAVELAGVLVFVYVQDQDGTPILRVSIDLDEASPRLLNGADPETATVAVKVTVQGHTVFQAT